jgi:putative phosphoesterase
MKISIISDTHGTIDPGILDIVESSDLCVHAGDVGNASVIEQVRERGTPIYAVLGNNDINTKWPASDYGVLNELPHQQIIDLPGGQLCMEHGHRVNPVKLRHQKLREKYPHARAVVYGHSHRLVCDQQSQPWVLNPGASGKSRTYGGASCIILTIATNGRWVVKMRRMTA